MAIIKLQGEAEKRNHICYQFNSEEPPIGEGGMGKVFKGVCVDERTGVSRPVAIKFMFDDLPANAYERARREAEIQLRNDNLVEMLGFIEISDRNNVGEVVTHYHVVSELLTGVSLSDILNGKTQDRNGQDVPFAVKLLTDYKKDPERFAKVVVMNVLSGLMALHDAGYIHRDIDPSNIMVTTDGHIKLIDFGIAKQMNTLTTSDKQLTVAGKFMGKPEYAAPELALGDISHQNQTTDIYAVGILLYQCIVGHTPFEGARHEILHKQLKEKLPLGKIKDKTLKKIIETACQKNQSQRFQTCAQMRVALESGEVAGGGSSKKNMIIIAAAVVALLIIGGAFAIHTNQKQKEVEQQQIAMVQKQKAEQKTKAIDDKITAVDMLALKGQDRSKDDYEKKLMEAYTSYKQLADMIGSDGDLQAKATEVQTKMGNVAKELKSACQELSKQIQLVEGTEYESKYKERVNRLNDFITQNNIQ